MQARELVKSGALGKIRVVQVEYPQDWLTNAADPGNKQASWRTDPKRSGAGGAIGDIGTHAYNLARFVTGLKTEAVSADLQSFVKGRKLDDNVHIMLRFAGGARGMLWASQVAVGSENGLQLRVYGEKAGLEWRQDNPNYMWFTEFGKPGQLLTRGGAISADPASSMNVRIPSRPPRGLPRSLRHALQPVRPGDPRRGQGRCRPAPEPWPTASKAWSSSSPR